jgi:hypothetical protein
MQKQAANGHSTQKARARAGGLVPWRQPSPRQRRSAAQGCMHAAAGSQGGGGLQLEKVGYCSPVLRCPCSCSCLFCRGCLNHLQIVGQVFEVRDSRAAACHPACHPSSLPSCYETRVKLRSKGARGPLAP